MLPFSERAIVRLSSLTRSSSTSVKATPLRFPGSMRRRSVTSSTLLLLRLKSLSLMDVESTRMLS
jgi:hypothetical protein